MASSALVVGQWALAPRLRGVIDSFTDRIGGEIMTAIDRLAAMRSLETAEGVWLDFLGTRLGLDRPSVADPSMDARWGFDGPPQSRGFDQAPYRGDAANDARYPLPDEVYRLMLGARAVLVIGDGTCQAFVKAIRILDPDATVVDNRDMTVTVTTARRPRLELADEIGALPRAAGVRVIYA